MTKGLHVRYLLALVAIGALAFAAAGCGGSDDSSSSSGGSESGSQSETTELTGSPVKIMTLASASSPTGSSITSPQIPPVAKATVEWVNDNGGINGRPLEVITCDDRGEPNQTEACAREATEAGVIALVGTQTPNSDKIYPIIEKTGTSNLGDLASGAGDFANKLSFPFFAATAALPGTGQLAAQQKECKNPGFVGVETPAYELVLNTARAGVESEGKKIAYDIAIPQNVTDYSSQAGEAAEKGDCLILFTVPDSAKAFVPALRQTSDQPIIPIPSSVNPELASELASDLEGTKLLSFYPPWSSPLSDEYREAMEEYSDPEKYELKYFYGPNTYLAVRVFAQIAATVQGELTPKSFTAALNKASEVETYGLLPPLNLTPENELPVPGFNRSFNRSVVETEIKDGEFVATSDGFTDLTEVAVKALGG